MLTAFSFICIRKTLLKHYSTLTYFIFSHNFPSGINKKGESFKTFSFRTQTRGRTGMEVNPLVFETSASTDSAIWAKNMYYKQNLQFQYPDPGSNRDGSESTGV